MKSTSRQKDINKALKAFPKLVKRKEIFSKKRKAFVERTFGALARKVEKQVKKSIRP